MKNKRKLITIILVISVAVILLIAALAIFLLPKLSREKAAFPSDDLSGVKYVSNSGLDYNEYSELIFGKYRAKREGYAPRAGNLEIKCVKDETDEKDYVTYWVFDSAEDAEKSYQNMYKFIIEYYDDRGEKGNDYILDKGSNWFEANMPANDAEIHQIYYLADNVVMVAETQYTSQWHPYEDTDSDAAMTDPSPVSSIAKESLSGYIKEHAAELRRFVLTEICPNIKKEA